MAGSAAFCQAETRTLRPTAQDLPVGTVGDYRSSGARGMLFLILTEASVFAYLIFG